MEKLVIIINGQGGVGKDTLCAFAAKHFRVRNISSVDPIKEIAEKYAGWHGQKDNRSRKFLADLKRLFADYCDLPFRYEREQYEHFLQTDEQILFVHIREPQEIAKLKGALPGRCVTLLVQKTGGAGTFGNAADDEVAAYPYDFIYQNDRPLSEAEADFTAFLKQRLLPDAEP